MANKFTYQTLRDSTTDVVIKLTGTFDGSTQELNTSRIEANTLYGALDVDSVPLYSRLSVSNTALPYYNLQMTSIEYIVNLPLGAAAVELFWSGGGTTTEQQYANSATILHMTCSGTYGGVNMVSIPNNATNPNGNLGISTTGSNTNSSYTLICSFRKDNAMYQRGQFSDGAAFNYGIVEPIISYFWLDLMSDGNIEDLMLLDGNINLNF